MITERWPVRCELVGLLVAGVSTLGCDRISATSEATPSPQTEAIGTMPSNAAAANTSNETAAKPGTAVAPTPSDGEGMLAELTPDTVVGPAGVWTTSEDPEDPYVRRDDRDAQLAFAVHSFAPDGVEHRVVVWAAGGDSEVTTAMFVAVTGGWRRLWVDRRLFLDPEPPDEPSLPWPLALGPGRVALVFSPSRVLCGGELCPPEVDYVDTRFVEVAPNGAAELLSVHGPACAPSEYRYPIDPDQCLVSTAPHDGSDVPDVLIERTRGRGHTKRYAYRGSKLVAIR